MRQIAPNAGQHFLSILALDVACGNDQIAGKIGIGHDVALFVNIIVLAIVGLHADNRQALGDGDVNATGLRLVTLGGLDERILDERLFHLAHIDLADGVAQRIKAGSLQQRLHLIGTQKALDSTLLDVDIHLRADFALLVRAIECSHSQQQIDSQQQVYQYDCSLF